MSKDGTQRVVVCAANRSKSGKIICGARHWDEAMRSTTVVNKTLPEEWLGAEQGFIDQFCVWMDRQEAYIVAKEAGQIKYPFDNVSHTLYSENLY